MLTEHPMVKHYPTESDIEHILHAFGIKKLLRVRKKLGGIFNVNLLVDTEKGKYVVRVLSGYASSKHIYLEQEIAHKLRERKIPAITMKLSRRGKPYIYWQNRKVQISRYRQGFSFSRSAAETEASGKMLRRMHRILKDTTTGPRPRWSNYPSFRTMGKGIQACHALSLGTPDQLGYIESIYQNLQLQWQEVGHHLPKTMLHCDWHPWNVLYDRKGCIRLIMDFDFARYGPRIYDVGYAMWMLTSHENTRHLAPDFLRGYGVIHKAERVALPYAMARAALFSLTTTSLLKDPEAAFAFCYDRNIPYLEWVLSDAGRAEVQSWLNESRHGL